MPQDQPAAPPSLAALLRAPATVAWLGLLTVAALFALTQVPLDGVGLAHGDGLPRGDILALDRLGLRAGLRGGLFTLLGAAWLVVAVARWLVPPTDGGAVRAGHHRWLGVLAIVVFGLLLAADHLTPTGSTWLDVPVRDGDARAEAIPRWRDDAAALAPVAGGHRGVCGRQGDDALRCAVDLAGEELSFDVRPGRGVRVGGRYVVWEATSPDVARPAGALTIERRAGRDGATRFGLRGGEAVRVPDLELLVHPTVDALLGPIVVGASDANRGDPVAWLAPRLTGGDPAGGLARWRGGEVARLRLRPAAPAAMGLGMLGTALLGLLVLLAGRLAVFGVGPAAATPTPSSSVSPIAPFMPWLAASAWLAPATLCAIAAGGSVVGTATASALAALAIATVWCLPGPIGLRHRGAALGLLCVAWPLAPADASLWVAPDQLRLLGLREGVASVALLGDVVPRGALAPWTEALLGSWRWLAMGAVLVAAWSNVAAVWRTALLVLVASVIALVGGHVAAAPTSALPGAGLLLLALVGRCAAAVAFVTLGRSRPRGAPASQRGWRAMEWGLRGVLLALLVAFAATQAVVGEPAWWRGGDGSALLATASACVLWPIVHALAGSQSSAGAPRPAIGLLLALRAASALALLGGGWTAWRVAGLWLP